MKNSYNITKNKQPYLKTDRGTKQMFSPKKTLTWPTGIRKDAQYHELSQNANQILQ